ncbi:MAG: thiamine diphosphokinase [Patescibacteria group bacterium]|nr:thiamine diphosphokinase [Patescibacteria group bacterium]
MKQKCILVTNGNSSVTTLKYNINPRDYLVGVDKGAIVLLTNHYSLSLAIGDFDSVTQKEFKLIKQKAKELIAFKKEKDYTDTELALHTVIEKGYRDIVILGAIGTRLDHTLVNILLLEKYQKHGVQITIIDNNNEIEIINNKKVINKNKLYKYTSFLSLTDYSIISLVGFKYPLKNKKISRGQTLCLSNELKNRQGMIEVKRGRILMVKSKD